MADALRWDYLPNNIQEKGVTVKTIAASLSTHTSIPSMITGLHPQQHQVMSWEDRIPDIEHLLNRSDLTTGYFQPGDEDMEDGTFSILDINQNVQLESLLEQNEDWVYFERHHGGHAPFNAIEPWDGSWSDWVKKYSGRPKLYRRDYARAIQHSASDFEKRIKKIKEYSELDNTLIIFTSDHGEFLGENGLLGHTSPLAPESVYVPTVFIHPDLETGMNVSGIMRHIDLYPTILSALDGSVPEFVSGRSLVDSQPTDGYSLAVGNLYYRKGYQIWTEHGLWDENGGHTFPDSNTLQRLAAILNKGKNELDRRHHLRRRSPSEFFDSIRPYMRKAKSFNNPGFDKEYARDEIERIKNMPPIDKGSRVQMDSATKERLQELGYL
jgi:arylsulfatase A-like enzyme